MTNIPNIWASFSIQRSLVTNLWTLVFKGRKRLNILKYISGCDWGADACTLRTTYSAIIRPILEYGFPVYCCASSTNLQKLERVQLSASRIIAGLRNSCPNKIALYETDLQPLSQRRNAGFVKYYNKLLSYGSQNRTSEFLQHWSNNQRLKKNSPLCQIEYAGIIDRNVEQHSLKQCLDPSEGLPGVEFHAELSSRFSKKNDIPALLQQSALETIHAIPAEATLIYTDGSKSEDSRSGSGVVNK
ncbi:uncharacterized protein LOC118205025 [Stegodyphus dumicola]|uniref:uncharacterized protein LOC118205025 n=1 Tax=Stegodyphus dumicola TaxID=202533 RepID=UPI0015AC7BAF|nr:uncharacterized protein LOC118205025 [Stegodyphus dumicola]